MTPEKLYVIFDEDGLVERVVNDPCTALDAILWCASDQSTEEDLSWALVDKTA